jgi:hypothetical protein
VATYVYAITGNDHPVRLTALKGVGDPPAPVRVVRTETLTAVVSDAPENLRSKRRDVAAHQAVLERLMADGAVLPMRFGLMGPDDREVEAALKDREDAYLERLSALAGCVEFNVKASRDENDLLREIVRESDEVRRLNEFTRDHPDAHNEKMRMGELITEEVKSREERDAQELEARLAPAAQRTARGEPTASDFLNVSFLVRQDEAAAFSQTVREEAETYSEVFAFRLSGPLPPYSFV